MSIGHVASLKTSCDPPREPFSCPVKQTSPSAAARGASRARVALFRRSRERRLHDSLNSRRHSHHRYTGAHIPRKQARKLPPHDPKNAYRTFYYSLENGDVIDAGNGGNAARWINHSCEPNCTTEEEDNRIFVHALRTIYPGEELFYD